MEKFRRILDDGEVLLNTYLKKPNELLTILNFINNDIQFSMKLSDNKLPFLGILIAKSDKQIWMNIYSKPANFKMLYFLPF